jgi:hypothetical protein
MLKLLSILAVAVFVLATGPSVQAAPAAGLLSLKSTNSVVEPAYWRHRHYWRHPVYWGHRHYWRHPVYWRHHRHWRY